MSKWSNLRWARLEFVCTTCGTYKQGSDRSKFNLPKEYLYLSPLKAPGPQRRTFYVRQGPKTKKLSDEGRPVLSDKEEKLAEVKNETDAPDPRERDVMLDQRCYRLSDRKDSARSTPISLGSHMVRTIYRQLPRIQTG